jgi:uncharacterized membrane protein YcaP (DUF421 family)
MERQQMDAGILLNGRQDVTHTLVLAFSAYAVLLLFLRISGKRTLTKLNVFDFIFVVALGSILADTILTPGSTLLKGATAMAVLIGLQVLISFATQRVEWIERVVNGHPTLLLLRGEFLQHALRRHRLTESEILAAARVQGIGRVEEIEAVVLETDGTLSVVHKTEGPPTYSGLHDVPGYPEAAETRRAMATVPR